MTSANLECNTHKESYGILILYFCGVFLSLYGKSYMKTLQKCLLLCFRDKKDNPTWFWNEFRCSAFIFRSVKWDVNPGHSMVSSVQTLHQEIMSLWIMSSLLFAAFKTHNAQSQAKRLEGCFYWGRVSGRGVTLYSRRSDSILAFCLLSMWHYPRSPRHRAANGLWYTTSHSRCPHHAHFQRYREIETWQRQSAKAAV